MREGVFLTLIAVLFAAPPAFAAAPYAVTFERDVEVRMRDGVALRADIYRPDSADRFPVLLQRTPYDKNSAVEFGLKAASRGYVVVVEDVRGRHASEGEWYPFKHESLDGYDTVEWAAALPYASGTVGMVGGSYVGATQMLAAIAHPPHLAGIAPVVTASDYHNGWTYQGGAFEQWFNESWVSRSLAPDTYNRALIRQSDIVSGTQILPMAEYPALDPRFATTTSVVAPYFLDWLAHPSEDGYWRALSIEAHFADITVPALHIGAWYDIFLGGSLRNYLGIAAHGGSEAGRRGQRLIVMIGGHAGNPPKVGALDFGPGSLFDADEMVLRWYDHLFKGARNEFDSAKPVRLFVMGANQWRDEAEWPPARAVSTRYFLHSGGAANGTALDDTDRVRSAGRGVLSRTPPRGETPDRYLYDPANAVPTLGGPLCCQPLPTGIGPQDQRPAEARADVLSYTTPVFTKDTEITGPVSLDLYVSSSAVDTDFTGMLVDVWPNGFAQNLTSGILRLRYRDSSSTPTLAVPGRIYHITVDLWATSNVFLAGHKLRLEVSSSNFPRFDRNLNTGEDQAHATRMMTAANVIYHDSGHPSAMVIPLVH